MSLKYFEEAIYFENIRCHYENSYYLNCSYNTKHNEEIKKNDLSTCVCHGQIIGKSFSDF